jgi:branched-chain amino acid aminotransferase
MHEFLFHNDQLLPLSEIRLSPGQAGLLNGWGIFTTIRVYEGVPWAFERHWNRLARDADRVQIPFTREPAAVLEAVRKVIGANRVQSGCIRIYFVFNQGTPWRSNERLPTVDLLIYSTDLPVRVGPADLVVMLNGRHASSPLAGTKVTAWLNNVWHLEQAHRQGFEEALLLNEREEVAECTAANLFCVIGGTVTTPPPTSGCLLGVTREVVLEIAPRAGIRAIERTLSLPEVLTAEEVFITSTTRNVQPVRRIDHASFHQSPGPITERLGRLLSEEIQTYVHPRQPRPGILPR